MLFRIYIFKNRTQCSGPCAALNGNGDYFVKSLFAKLSDNSKIMGRNC